MTTQSVNDFLEELFSLEHHGIKGMKWGVRNDKPQSEIVLTKTFSTGDSVSIYKDPPPTLVRLISKRFPKYKENNDAVASFTFKDKDGTNVGSASFVRENKDTLYLEWIGIKKDHRGKGYASAALEGVVKYARNENIKTLSLEVPGNSPDARHIYEKLGFSFTGETIGNSKDYFSGLSTMTLSIDSAQHEASLDNWAVDFSNDFAQFLSDNLNLSELSHAYDAAKAREYYLRTRELKGRKKGHQDPVADKRRAAQKAAAKKAKAAAIKQRAEKRVAALKARLAKLEKALELLVKQAKARSGVQTPSKTAASKTSSSSTSKNTKPLTAAQKRKAAKAAEERRKKEGDPSLDAQAKQLEAKIKKVQERIKKMKAQIAAAKKKARARSKSKTASNGR